jgi:flavin reductase (DIM6/NTAB) family NADH-FMN oxidoreductase RutF
MLICSKGKYLWKKMSKVKIAKKVPTLALPICLVGANVGGRPNFCTIAWLTMIDDEPPLIGLVMAKQRLTKDGIKENKTFSVNIPSTKQAVETDYCGIVSGAEVDKSHVFRVEYGELGTAPMAVDCPLVMECRLRQIVEFEGTDLVVGEVMMVYSEMAVLRDGKPDLSLIDPLLYGMPGGPYFSLGAKVADAFKAGKKLKR